MSMLDVAKAIADARIEVAADPAGILPLNRRKHLWTVLATGLDEQAALAARVRLDVMCVRRVMPVWAARFDPGEIDAMLALADGL